MPLPLLSSASAMDPVQFTVSEEPKQDIETFQELTTFRNEMKLEMSEIRKILEEIRLHSVYPQENRRQSDAVNLSRLPPSPSKSSLKGSRESNAKVARISSDSALTVIREPSVELAPSCQSSVSRKPVRSRSGSCITDHSSKTASLLRASRRKSAAGAADEPTNLFGKMNPDTNRLDEEEYDVSMYYRKSGCSQYVAKNETFANITFGVIALNTVYIGIDADHNPAHDDANAVSLPFLICDNIFCIFFTFEWAVRFLAFARKRDCLKDLWFVFDAALVAFMLWETWIMQLLDISISIPAGMFKMLRLLRVARMARLFRAVPELVAMIKGLKVASRAVTSALLMLVLLLYVFAFILFLQLRDSAISGFHTLGYTMWTLLCDGVFLQGLGTLSINLLHAGLHLEVVLLTLFVLASNLTVLNMLVGVLCEVVSSVAACEKETAAIRLMKRTLLVLLKGLDDDNNGSLSQEEIEKVLDDQDAVTVLRSLDVDTGSLLEELDMYYAEKGDLTIQEIMELILVLRGERSVTVRDMLHGQGVTRYKIAEVKEDLATIFAKLDGLRELVAGPKACLGSWNPSFCN